MKLNRAKGGPVSCDPLQLNLPRVVPFLDLVERGPLEGVVRRLTAKDGHLLKLWLPLAVLCGRFWVSQGQLLLHPGLLVLLDEPILHFLSGLDESRDLALDEVIKLCLLLAQYVALFYLLLDQRI